MNSKKILIIVFNTVKTDVRVLRQIETLKGKYSITLVSYGGKEIAGISMIDIPKVKMTLVRKMLGVGFLLSRMYDQAYWQIYNYKNVIDKKLFRDFDLILANDIETFPLAFEIQKLNGAKILFDAHEYAIKQFENDRRWRILFKGFNYYLSKSYIPLVDGMITQNQLFADEFKNEFGVTPEIMTNAPEYSEIEPHRTDPDQIKIIHHGIYNTTRKIEKLLKVITLLPDNYSLYLMLHLPALSNDASKERFKLFLETARTTPGVYVLEPVDGNEVINAIKEYDIGIHILEPINYNHAYSLPNKILEFAQARLAAVIGPSPGMVEVVNRYGFGVVADDFSAEKMADSIRQMSIEQIDQFKHKSDESAYELSSEKNKKVLLRIVESMVG